MGCVDLQRGCRQEYEKLNRLAESCSDELIEITNEIATLRLAGVSRYDGRLIFLRDELNQNTDRLLAALDEADAILLVWLLVGRRGQRHGTAS